MTEGRTRQFARAFFAISFVSTFIGGPQLTLGPANLRVFDVVFPFMLILLAHFGIISTIVIPELKLGLFIWGLYLGLVILLPVYGVAIYGFPFQYLLGDVRWVQLLLIVAIVFYAYRDSIQRFMSDLKRGMKMVIAVNLIFVVIQFLTWSSVLDLSYLLDLWYSSRPRYDELGFAFGRFAGAHSFSSQLGLSSVVGLSLFSHSYIHENKDIAPLCLSVVLLIASGHRTSIVAAGAVVFIYIFYLTVDEQSNIISLHELISIIMISLPLGIIVYALDIGRIRTSDRYIMIFKILAGDASFLQVSGRGPVWRAALQEATKYPFGTLTVPSHVLQSSVIDSYFVVAYIQGGIILLGVYLLFLGTVLYYALNIVYFDDRALVSVSLMAVSSAHSLTQNFATSIQGKFVLFLTITIVSLIYRHHSSVQNTK